MRRGQILCILKNTANWVANGLHEAVTGEEMSSSPRFIALKPGGDIHLLK